MKLAYRILLCTFVAAPAWAGIGAIRSPEIHRHELEIEYKGKRYGDHSGSALNNAQEHEIEIEYAFTDRFKAGVGLELERNPGEGSSLEAEGVEAQYQFTGQRQGWWLSSALKGEYSRAAHSGDADEGELQFLLARTQGDVRVVGNIDLAHEIGPSRDPGIELESKLQAYYRGGNRYAKPGLEWHAEWGKVNALTTDGGTVEHYVGPILTGTLFRGNGHELEYTAGYYWGLTGASANTAQRLELEYSVQF